MAARLAIAVAVLLLLIGSTNAQRPCTERFPSGEYKGMLSCTAFQYVVLDDPFTVREAKGTVTVSSDGQPIPNVVVELRDQVGNVVATATDSQGRFRFKHLQDGTYKFKTTSLGFSSVMGTIVLNRHADRNRTVSVKMPVGV
jgi:hypothetical protein